MVFPIFGMSASSGLTFELFKEGDDYLPTIADLDPTLIINSVSVTPTFRYKAGDANATDWAPWTYGETLTRGGAGPQPTYNSGSPLMGSIDDGIKFNASGILAADASYYEASNATFADITTEDFCYEAIYRLTDGGDAYVFTKGNAAAGPGHGLWSRANTLRAICVNNNALGTYYITHAGSTSVGIWNHILVFFDRNENSTNGAHLFFNGVLVGTANLSAQTGSLTNVNTFKIGANYNYTSGFTSDIAYLAMWQRASWFAGGATNATDWLAIAKDRFFKLTKLYPQIARGTSAPTVFTRTAMQSLDKYEGSARKIYFMGAGWFPYVSRKDKDGTAIKGILFERGVQNKLQYTIDFSNAIWTKLDAGDTISTNQIASPSKAVTADGIVADATDGDHGVSQPGTCTASTVYWFSVFAKKGNKDWLYLSDDTVANAYAYFDINTGTVGTIGAGCVFGASSNLAQIEDWGDGWFRCAIGFTGTAAAHTFKIQPAHADTDKDFAGDGAAINTYLWGAQVENSLGPTSYIYCPANTLITRGASLLRYKGDDGNLGGVGSNKAGTFYCKMAQFISNLAISSQNTFFYLNDGGAAGDSIKLQTLTSNGLVDVNTLSTGGNNGDTTGTVNTGDKAIHTLRLTWANNNLKAYVDGVADGTPDTVCDMPDDLDRIEIGSDGSSTQCWAHVINTIKIYGKIKVP